MRLGDNEIIRGDIKGVRGQNIKVIIHMHIEITVDSGRYIRMRAVGGLSVQGM